MDPNREEVNRALSLIAELDLPHPSGALLASFVNGALHPVEAARYVNDKVTAGDVQSLVSDWIYIVESVTNGRIPPPPDATEQLEIRARDGNRCCITGKTGTARDPLIVVPVLPVPSGWVADNPRIFEMLGVFFSPPYRDWWLSYARAPERMLHYYSHWLVQKSAAQAFAQGLVKLERQQPSMIEYKVEVVHIGPEKPIEIKGPYPLLGDHSRAGILTVDARFIGTQARLARSIRYVEIAKSIAPQILPRKPGELVLPAMNARKPSSGRSLQWAWLSPLFGHVKSLINFIGRGFVSSLRILPRSARSVTYDALRKLGEMIYGRDDPSLFVQRLPFELFLKYRGTANLARNEFNALRMVQQRTCIPAPKPFDVIPNGDDSYLLTTRLPGVPLWLCQEVLSDADCDAIVTQLKDYLSQLRDIPQTVNPEAPICNTLGEACRDHRIRGGDPIGPFADEAAFSQCLRFSDEPSRRGHKIVLTHADLNPRNILVDQVALPDGTTGWRVTGIVDWETAGFYPEYWDYTKALFEGFRWKPRYIKMVHRVFEEFGDYSRELDVEKRSWEAGDGI
ncbi:hypothetical protein L209DRAFT_724385 [Thermothelomyces heterothallicus CBS 203.75]